MKIVYASRMGKVEKLVNALSEDAFKIENGNQTINEDYVIIYLYRWKWNSATSSRRVFKGKS